MTPGNSQNSKIISFSQLQSTKEDKKKRNKNDIFGTKEEWIASSCPSFKLVAVIPKAFNKKRRGGKTRVLGEEY